MKAMITICAVAMAAFFFASVSRSEDDSRLTPREFSDMDFTATVSEGTGAFAPSGTYTIRYNSSGISILTKASVKANERIANYKYEQHGRTQATITEVFKTEGYPANMETQLFFDSPSTGTAVAHFVNGPPGRQVSRFSISPVSGEIQSGAKMREARLPDIESLVTNKSSVGEPTWQSLAELLSFTYSVDDWKTKMPLQENLFIPVQNYRMPKARDVEDTITILSQYDALCDASDLQLRTAAQEGRTYFKARRQLALANDQFGNTPVSSIRAGTNLIQLGVQHAIQKNLDEETVRKNLQEQYPNYRVIVDSAPQSEATRQALDNMLQSAGTLLSDARDRAGITGQLTYADSNLVRKVADLWRDQIMPCAVKMSGPQYTTATLVGLGAQWDKNRHDDNKSKRLDHFMIKNMTDNDLHDAFVELVATNEWNETIRQYYFFATMAPGRLIRLAPEPKWNNRRLDFTNTMTVRITVWSREAKQRIEMPLNNPAPNSDPEGWRRESISFDDTLERRGIALGMVIQGLDLIPTTQTRTNRVLKQLARAGSQYAFTVVDERRTTSYLIKFTKSDLTTGMVEAEVTNTANKMPWKPGKIAWSGSFNSQGEFRMEDGWSIGVTPDDHLKIIGTPNSESKSSYTLYPISTLN